MCDGPMALDVLCKMGAMREFAETHKPSPGKTRNKIVKYHTMRTRLSRQPYKPPIRTTPAKSPGAASTKATCPPPRRRTPPTPPTPPTPAQLPLMLPSAAAAAVMPPPVPRPPAAAAPDAAAGASADTTVEVLIAAQKQAFDRGAMANLLATWLQESQVTNARFVTECTAIHGELEQLKRLTTTIVSKAGLDASTAALVEALRVAQAQAQAQAHAQSEPESSDTAMGEGDEGEGADIEEVTGEQMAAEIAAEEARTKAAAVCAASPKSSVTGSPKRDGDDTQGSDSGSEA